MAEQILVTRSSMPEFGEYMDEIQGLWDTHWLTNMGVKHRSLQEELKGFLGVENVELLTNGHMAMMQSIVIIRKSSIEESRVPPRKCFSFSYQRFLQNAYILQAKTISQILSTSSMLKSA